MPVASMKNSLLTPSVAGDLGLGDELKDDVQAQLIERRKKLNKLAMGGAVAPGSTMGPATMSLFPNIGG